MSYAAIILYVFWILEGIQFLFSNIYFSLFFVPLSFEIRCQINLAGYWKELNFIYTDFFYVSICMINLVLMWMKMVKGFTLMENCLIPGIRNYLVLFLLPMT